ncbi:ABC transporter phosphate-binding protein PstS [Gottschalkia purinilytica]|uniref:ABC transporter phosphate-binding protein PstS n=1 Tax=Gottschalkia purinilytica TaxID=1503 RepID=A0A0L0W7M2_GOTPU|nr:phosphate ABC transporter substrate-binding protein [Gottschalkia purinilytica]KNF07524.1 ABC transporter phosphate-binding protein PstS [Gottschalkia purinilytica]
MKRFFSIFISVFLSLSLVLTGCSKDNKDQSNEAKDNVQTSSEDVKKFEPSITFNGSSTLAPVISAISTDFIEDNTTWNKVDDKFPEENIAIYVSAGGSGAGIKAVIDGTSDFGMVAREIKEEEKKKIKDIKEVKIGIDALTIAVNPENPLHKVKNDLSKDEIKKIFAGEYKYWDEVDKSLPHTEIVVVTRDLSGGAHEVFQKNIMGDTQVRQDAIQSPSMGALVSKIMENKNTMGYASFGMVNQNEGKLIPLKVDGVEPTKESILDGSYIISRPLIVVKKGELTPTQQHFIDTVMSEEGLKIIEEMGFVPVK